MQHVKASFFASLHDHVGVRSVESQVPEQTNIAELKTLLIEKLLILRGWMGHMLISVNRQDMFDDAILPDAAQIALFPPGPTL